MSANHGISDQVIDGPIKVSDEAPFIVVDKNGVELAMFGKHGDTTNQGAHLAAIFVALFNETDVDLSQLFVEAPTPAPVVEPAPVVTPVVEPAAQ